MASRVWNTTILAALLLSWVAFGAVSIFIERQNLFEALNAMIAAVAIGVTVAFWPRAWRALRMPAHRLDAADILIVGMVICSVGCAAIFIGQWAWRAWDPPKPDWIVDSYAFAFSRWIFLTGAVLVLMSGNTRDGVVSRAAYARAGVIVAIALSVAAILSLFGFG